MIGKAAQWSEGIRIGTRGSQLALVQAGMVQDRLVEVHGIDPDRITIVPITTSGDRIQDRPVHQIGGKGVFCKEIEEKLLDGLIDIAVHSLKDMPAVQPDGLYIGCILKRGDPRDALVSSKLNGVTNLPPGTRLGTSSIRRRTQLLKLNPSLNVEGLRGNVQTRLEKLAEGSLDGAILALEGLRRLEIQGVGIHPLEASELLPSPAQAAICVERRTQDHHMADLLLSLDDAASRTACEAEREFLRHLGGDCTTPIGALATIKGSRLTLTGELLHPDGGVSVRDRVAGHVSEHKELGKRLACRIAEEFGRVAERQGD